MNKILQKQIEEKSKGLAHKYFPNEMNIWARPNYEAQYVESACKEIATFALQNQWISVEEALPEYDEDVFVRFVSRFPNNTDEFEVGYCTRWRTLEESVKTDSKGFSIIGDMEITHWMSIPEMEGGEK